MTKRACFIIAPIGARLGALADVIARSGWRVLNDESDTVASSRRGFADMIARADAVITVDPGMSANLLIETGIALGRGIPMLLVVVNEASLPAYENEPSLALIPRVRAKINDTAALHFHIPAFLDSVGKPTSLLTPPTPPLDFPKSASKLRPAYPQSALEQRLLNLFERSAEVAAIAQDPYPPSPAGAGYRPDFAVWLDGERSIVINPVLVDVTRGLTPNEFERKLQILQQFVQTASAGLMLLVEDNQVLPLTLAALNPLIVRIGITHLQHLLETRQLVRAVTEARNRTVHGLG